MTKRQLEAEIVRLRATLTQIVETGTRTVAVRIGDMYDMQGGYDDYETVSEEAEIASKALAETPPPLAHLNTIAQVRG